jgi:hypothetical protein
MRTVAFVLFMALLAATAVSALRTEVRLREPTAEMELVDESSFVEQAPVAAPAPLVPAEPVSVPANTTKPAANLKKPIIFLNRTHTPKDPSEPLTGPVPKKLKKAAISKNIYGGAVHWKKGRDRNGCPCKRQVAEKYRYDAQYKPEKVKFSTKCCCKKKKNKKPKLPPVVAELYPKKPKKHRKGGKNGKKGNKGKKGKKGKKHHPCAKPKAKKPKIAPEYYPAKPKKHKKKKAPCHKKAPKKNATVTPEFYPARPQKLRKHRKGKKANKKKL